MRLPMLHVCLWLLVALTTSSQEMVSLQASPSVSAACGQHVTLPCAVASSLDGLSIKHMEWTFNGSSLCSVDARGRVTTPLGNTTGRFHCQYMRRWLTLVLHQVRPKDAVNSDYMCKLKSNQGGKHTKTRVELQECSGDVQTAVSGGATTCVFHRVHEGRDVHWFGGQHEAARLHEDIDTSSVMDGDGWWTVTSTLQRRPTHKAFNCSLVSKSGRNLGSALVQPPPSHTPRTTNTGGSLLTSTWSSLCVSIITLFFILKP